MINNTIKIILVFVLVAVVVTGLFLFFRDTVIDFIKNLFGGGEFAGAGASGEW